MAASQSFPLREDQLALGRHTCRKAHVQHRRMQDGGFRGAEHRCPQCDTSASALQQQAGSAARPSTYTTLARSSALHHVEARSQLRAD